jgi:hypothetical protein
MNRFILAALFAAAAAAAMPSFAHRGGGGHPGRAFHGGAFHGHGFARAAPFRGVGGFPVHRGFFPRHHHHHRSAVFIGAGLAFPAYYYPRYPAYYPAYQPAYPVGYAAPYPAHTYRAVPVDPGPVMRLYCPDPAGYFPAVPDCRQDWVQVPHEADDASR